jgi:ABC-2 type transport system ATP-binding protein
MALVEVEGLVFDYPGHRALHGVSLEIEPGGITALVGPNGAGKTTLMRCLAALDRPAAGKVRVEGIDLSQDPRAVHQVLGYLSDFFGLYNDLSVEHCLLYRGLAQGLEECAARDAAAKAAERVRLQDRMKQKAGALSRGLRQRLGIAQAILHEPRFVILDEPASGLDPEARDDLAALLRELRAQGMTLLVSSHILSELSDYASDMLLLEEGRIVEHRTVEQREGAEGEEPQLLRIKLVQADGRLPEILRDLVGAERIESADDRGARLLISGGGAERHELLRSLLQSGCQVSDFAAETADLQSLYRARLRKGATQREEA